MSKTTLSFALPDELRRDIDDRVRSGEYGNTSEYLRELIRRDQQYVAERRLRDLIADGLESGDGRPATVDIIEEIRQHAFAADTYRRPAATAG
jgi:antitoxin ParD1/3/4